MSGRPANPSYTTRTWATDASYPAGSDLWSSQPTKAEHPGPAGGFVPGQGGGAPYFNKLFNDAFTQDANAKTSLDALFDFVGSMPALNFRANASDVFNCAAWNPAERRWYFGADTAVIKYSANQGASFSADVLSAVAGTNNILTMASDPSGNMMALTAALDWYEYNKGTTTWAQRSNVWVTDTPHSGETYKLVYDPVHSKWIAGGVKNGGGSPGGSFQLFHTSDRINWTASLGEQNNTGSLATCLKGCLAVNPSTGLVMGCYVGDPAGTPTLVTATSSDGGANFTQQPTSGISFLPTNMSLTFEPDAGLFVLVAATNSGAGTTKVYTSTDGSSWTLKTTLSAACLFSIQCLGDLWVS